MNEDKTKTQAPSEEKPGLLKRMFIKLDNSMKQKADAKAEEGCCCSGKDSKGNKCC